MDDDIEIAKVVEVEHKSDSSLVKMDINDNLEKREDEAFNREFDIGYNCVVLHKHPNIDTKGVYYKILNSPDEKFQDIEKYPFFETNEQWNLIPNLESGKTYVFFKKGKNDLISPHYAKIRLLAKPSSIKDIYETFNATYEEFFKLNLHRNLKNMGINKLNIGVVGHSGEGKSVLISSLITILDTQNNDNTKTKINFAFSNPEKKKIIPSKDPPKKHQNIDKINLLEFPQYFQNVDSDPMEDQYKNDLISCHAIILTIKWETVRNLNLAIRYQKCDENGELFKDYSSKLKNYQEDLRKKLHQIQLIRQYNKSTPILIAITNIDKIHNFVLKKYTDFLEHPICLSLKKFFGEVQGLEPFLCPGFSTYSATIDPTEYYSKAYMILTLFIKAFKTGHTTLVNDLNIGTMTENEKLSKAIIPGYCKVVGKIPDYDSSLESLYYWKSADLKFPLESDTDFEKWKKIPLREKRFIIRDLDPKEEEYVVVLQNKTKEFEKVYGRFKTKKLGNNPVDNFQEALNNLYSEHEGFNLHPNYQIASLKKLNIGVYGESNSGKSSLIAGLKTIMKNKRDKEENKRNKEENKENKEENKKYIFENPTPPAGGIEKVKRIDFEHGAYCAYEFSEHYSDPDKDNYKKISDDVRRKIHSGIFVLEAPKVRECLKKGENLQQYKNQVYKIKQKEGIGLSIALSKLDEVIVEKFTSLTYTEIIGHPNYLQLKDFIAQKFGYSIEIFPCMTFFENPFCDYRSEEDQLKNHFNNVGFMCMNIFSQAINDALSNLKKNHWVCLRQKISVKEEKIVDCFMVNQKENIENWIDFQKIIRDNAKDQTGTYLDKKYKEITGKPETSDVTENEDGFIYVNWTNKSIDKSNELGEVILCFSSPTFDDILQDYSEVKLNMTLHEFRAGIIDNPEKNSNTPKSYRFCKLKQEKMINPTSYKDFKTLSLQDEKTVKIKEIQFQPDFYDKKSAVLIVPHDVTLEVVNRELDGEFKGVTTLENIDKEKSNLKSIRTEILKKVPDFKACFLRKEKIENKEKYLLINQASEEKFLLEEFAEEILNDDSSSKRVYKICVQLPKNE